MDIYVIDGTYELFRYFYAVPSAKDTRGQEIGAVRGVLGSVLSLIEGGATHVGVATNHVSPFATIFTRATRRAKAWIRHRCRQQFPILEEALQSMGAGVADDRIRSR